MMSKCRNFSFVLATLITSAHSLRTSNTSAFKHCQGPTCNEGLHALKEKLKEDGGFPIPEDGFHTNAVEGGADSGLFAYLGQLSHAELSRVGRDHAAGTICETGFNYGTSSYAFLCSTGAKVFSWDLGAHNYVEMAQALVSADFPKRHDLIIGDSQTALPAAVAASGNGPLGSRRCDFVYVDGGHTEAVATSDIDNFAKLATPGALVVVDDCHHGGFGHIQGVSAAFDMAVKSGKLVPETAMARKFTFGRSLCVGRYSKTSAFLQRSE